MSCGGDNTNLEDCDCTFAQELFDQGLLVCEDRERCPRSCPICSTCLSVLGCPEGEGSRLSSATLVYIIVGSVVFLVIALALVHSHRKKKQENDLSQQLIPDAKDKDTNDPNQENQSGWEPPLVDSADSGGLAVPVGGAVWKNSKDESDTDDEEEEETIDETLDETMLSTSVDGPVPSAATEDVADGPEDEMAMEDEAAEDNDGIQATSTIDGDDGIQATSTIDGDETAPVADQSSDLEETEGTKDLENEPSPEEPTENTPETSEEEEPAAESSEPSDDLADEVQTAESSDTLGAPSSESPESTDNQLDEAPIVETAESADESLTRQDY